MKLSKKIISAAAVIFCASAVFAFSPISLVTFRTGLSYTIGQDTQTNTYKRTVKPFSINKYETSYGLWYETRVKAENQLGYYFANPGQPGSEGRRAALPTEDNSVQPVTMISWYDAIVWCNALSELKGHKPCYTYEGKVIRDSGDTTVCDLCTCDFNANGFRLPSEAEWEYAARRTKSGFQKGNLASGQNSSEDDKLFYAWLAENANGTRVVGTAGIPFDPNTVSEPGSGNTNNAGLFDMTGNVLEFCWDWFAEYTEADSYGPAVGYERVSRGSSWSEYTMFDYAGDRYYFDPNEYYNYFGFRICCTASSK